MAKVSKTLGIIIRLLIIVAIIGFGFFIYQACAGTPIVQKIDKTLPDVSAAPYDVATVTRTYKAVRAVANDDGSVTMTGWYEQIDGKWVYNDRSITLLPVLRPYILKR